MRLAVLLARTMVRFSFCCRGTAGSLRQFVAARSERSRWLSGKTSATRIASGYSIREIARACNGQRNGEPEVVRHGGRSLYQLTKPIIGPGSRLSGPRPACLPGIGSCGGSLPVSHPGLVTGADFRCSNGIQQQEAYACPGRLPQLIHPGSRSAEKGADPAPAVKRLIRRSLENSELADGRGQIVEPSPSAKGPQRLKSVPFLVIGRGDLLSGTGNSHITSHERWNDIRVFTITIKVQQGHSDRCRRVDPAGS